MVLQGMNFRIVASVIWILYYFWVGGICKDGLMVTVNLGDDYKPNNK